VFKVFKKNTSESIHCAEKLNAYRFSSSSQTIITSVCFFFIRFVISLACAVSVKLLLLDIFHISLYVSNSAGLFTTTFMFKCSISRSFRQSTVYYLNPSILLQSITKKVKAIPTLNSAPCHEGVRGSEGIAPCILNPGTDWRWVVSFTPWLLYPWRKSPRYPLGRRLGGHQNRPGLCGE
jgi:hypothetical protein